MTKKSMLVESPFTADNTASPWVDGPAKPQRPPTTPILTLDHLTR
ncbi:hypothetical protein [Paenarthrobacter sp. 22069]